MKPIRILLAEDQTLMRQGLKTLLETESDFRVVGEAEDGKAAVKLALQSRPDIILMDVQMPQMNGVEATAAICRAWPAAKVIILTTFDRDDYVFQGVRAGAVGYLLKDLPAEKLVETIRRVHGGEVFIQDNCIGCGNCERNCPYGVIQMAATAPEKPGLFSWLLFGAGPGPGEAPHRSGPAGPGAAPQSPKKAVKCDMCRDLSGGPACVRACPTGAAIRIGPEKFVELIHDTAR